MGWAGRGRGSRVPGKRARRAPPGLGREGLGGLFNPRGSRAGTAAVSLCWGCVCNGSCRFPPRHNTRGCCGETGLSTLLARCQETRSAPCLCASKFHCLRRHPTLRGAAAWLLAGPRGPRWGPGSAGGGRPPPRFSGPGPGAAGTAERRRLCLKVGLLGPHSLPRSWARAPSSLGMGCFHDRRNAARAPTPPCGVGGLAKLRLLETPSLSKFSHDGFGAR